MKRSLIKIFFLLAFFCGCSEVTTLNLRSHKFNAIPKKIIWIQVAGLSFDHLAMLRFSKSDSKKLSSLENSSCMGRVWNYNLYNLRPDPYQGFMAQMVGKNNIHSSCEDFNYKPLWSYFQEMGYQTGIFESSKIAKSSLSKAQNCADKNQFLKDTVLWKMEAAPSKKEESFHYLEKKIFDKKGIYFDKSCQKKICHTSLFSNVKSVYRRFNQGRGKTLFIIRDFSFYRNLKKRKIGRAKEVLVELEKLIQYLKKEAGRDDHLIVLSSSGEINFEFPKSGKEWAAFEKSGKYIIYRNRSLSSPIFASGAGSENFCGVYEEWEVLKRFLFRPSARSFPYISLPGILKD